MERGDDAFGNSHRSRRPAQQPEKEPKDEKVVEVVVTGKAIVRKKSLAKRAKEIIFGGDSNSVRNYLIWDIVVPQIKDVVTEVVTQGIERLIHGDDSVGSRRSPRPGSYTNYNNRYSRNTPASPNRPNGRSAPSVRAHQVDEVVVPNRLDAQRVINRLVEIAEKYQAVTVADLYGCVEWSASHTDGNWGWHVDDIDDFSVRKVRDGYLIDLPSPEFLN